MSDTNNIVESAPGAARAWKAAREQASAIHAVPQYKALTIGLKNGWDCHLEPYQYQPLIEPDEIRLLRIFPWEERLQTKDGHSMPRCELIHVNLNSSPEYATISYAWGNLLEHSPVLLHEQRVVNVTNSLFEAICWASVGVEEPLDFWADQICINQHDLVERGKEVKLMARIYKQASLTFVWLGASNETDELAFDLIKKLSLDDLPLVKAFDLLNEGDVDGLRSILQPYGIDCNDSEPGWIAIKDLSLRPWFTRLWTFQEFVVSKDVTFVCGRHHSSSEELLRAFYATQLLLKSSTGGMLNTELLYIHRSRYLTGRFANLLELLWEIWESDYQCRDQRDRIFSLLAVNESDQSYVINVDYSFSVAKVFLTVAREIIKNTGSLKILTRRRFGELEELPSWAPDWSFKRSKQMAIDDARMLFSSSKGLQHIFEESEEHILIVRGKTVSTIAKVASHKFSEYWDEYHNGDLESFLGSRTLIPQVLETLETCQSIDGLREERSREHWNRLLATTFTAGRFNEENEAKFNADGAEDRLNLATIIARRGRSFAPSLQKCMGRKIAMLDTYAYPLGLVPEYARAGDFVCIMSGSTTPLVLRTDGQCFEVIGECYVNGIMYGEAVEWNQEGGETFIIK
jgi:hypothetical protein